MLAVGRSEAAATKQANSRSHVIPFTITAYEEDRDGDVVLPLGGYWEDYRRNPVVFFGHQQWEVPIGSAKDDQGRLMVWPEENRVRAACRFDMGDPDAAYIYEKVIRGFLNAASIAFVPIEAYRREDVRKAHVHGDRPQLPPGWFFKRWIATEWSIVGTPSCGSAIRDSMDAEKSFMSPQLYKAMKPYAAMTKGCWNGWCPCPDDERPMTTKKNCGCKDCKDGNPCQCAKEQPSDKIDPDKACKILHDGKVNGQPLTEDQRKMFGAACSRAKSSHGGLRETCKALLESKGMSTNTGTTGGYVVTVEEGYSPCTTCHGSGNCRKCEGTGEWDHNVECDDCKGTGNCRTCKGKGYFKKKPNAEKPTMAATKPEKNLRTKAPKKKAPPPPADDDDDDIDEDTDDEAKGKGGKGVVTTTDGDVPGDDDDAEVDETAADTDDDGHGTDGAPPEATPPAAPAVPTVAPKIPTAYPAPFVPKASAQEIAKLFHHARSESDYLNKALGSMDHPGVAQGLQQYKAALVDPRFGHLNNLLGQHHPDHNMDELVRGLETDAGAGSGAGDMATGEANLVDQGQVPPAGEAPLPPTDTAPPPEESMDQTVAPMDDSQADVGVGASAGEGIPAGSDTEEILERYRHPTTGKMVTRSVGILRVAKDGRKFLVRKDLNDRGNMAEQRPGKHGPGEGQIIVKPEYTDVIKAAADHLDDITQAPDIPRYHHAGLRYHVGALRGVHKSLCEMGHVQEDGGKGKPLSEEGHTQEEGGSGGELSDLNYPNQGDEPGKGDQIVKPKSKAIDPKVAEKVGAIENRFDSFARRLALMTGIKVNGDN